jgi:hypothetical protein
LLRSDEEKYLIDRGRTVEVAYKALWERLITTNNHENSFPLALIE